jgi:hypothetical protein
MPTTVGPQRGSSDALFQLKTGSALKTSSQTVCIRLAGTWERSDQCFSWSRGCLVGLAGLEPAASSLSGIEGLTLCGPAFSQVTVERQGRRDAFLATSSQAVQARPCRQWRTQHDWSQKAARPKSNSACRSVPAGTSCRRLSLKARRMECGYWSGMRRVKNSTSSDAAGGSRLLRLTTT